MELLEGVVAYHSGQLDKAQKALSSAQTKFSQVTISSSVDQYRVINAVMYTFFQLFLVFCMAKFYNNQ